MRCINKNIRFYLDRNKAVSTVYVPINKHTRMTTKRISILIERKRNVSRVMIEQITSYSSIGLI